MKTPEALLADLGRSAITFESPSRGAVCIARLRWGLPVSETIRGLDEAQLAIEAIRKTMQHPHRHEHWFDQAGAGRWFELERDVTEDGRRWTFTVRVLARADGAFLIDDANVVRSEDREDADDAGASAVPAGMVACPCCGHATLSERAGYHICPVCFWEDDGQDNANLDEMLGGPNRVSLRDARRSYRRIGASVEADLAHVRRPTAEEAPLRTFDDDGNETTGG